MEFLNSFILITNYIIIPGLTYGSQLALGALGISYPRKFNLERA